MKLATIALSLLVLAPAAARAQTLLHEWVGDAAGDQMGSVVAGVGDVNGDNRGDVAVRIGGAQEVRVYSGASGNLLRTFTAENGGDDFGRGLAAAGDVDGDGRGDVIIGAPGYDGVGVADIGKIYVYNVTTGALIRSIADGAGGERLGYSVAGLLDGTLVAGGPYYDLPIPAKADVGRVVLYNALTGARIRAWIGENALDRFGWSVSRVGNVNAAGGVDFVVGAPGYDGFAGSGTGKAYVYDAATGASAGAFTGSDAGSALGHAVSGAGDADGDGRDDVVAAAPYYDGPAGNLAGRVYLWSPAAVMVLHTFDGEEEFGEFGDDAAGAGDVDGDGRGDVVVGARYFHGTMPYVLDRGKAYFYSGASGALLGTVLGTHGEDGLGSSVDGVGDTNDDGTSEVILGAILADGPMSEQATGRAYLYSVLPPGPTCSPLAATGSPWSAAALYAGMVASIGVRARRRRKDGR